MHTRFDIAMCRKEGKNRNDDIFFTLVKTKMMMHVFGMKCLIMCDRNRFFLFPHCGLSIVFERDK